MEFFTKVVTTDSDRPLSLTSRDHVGDKTSYSDIKVHGKNGKVKFPYRLCEDNHPIYHLPSLDESSKVLENLTASQPWLLASYPNLSPNPPLDDEVIDHNPNTINLTLSECESHESVTDQPLVEVMVDSIPTLVDRTFPVESKVNTSHILPFLHILMRWGGTLPFQWKRETILLFPQHKDEIIPLP